MNTATKSEIFKTFNAAKKLAEAGTLEKGRVNRALGLAQRKDQTTDYEITIDSCSCPDHFYRGVACKHIIALVLGNTTYEGDN